MMATGAVECPVMQLRQMTLEVKSFELTELLSTLVGSSVGPQTWAACKVVAAKTMARQSNATVRVVRLVLRLPCCVVSMNF